VEGFDQNLVRELKAGSKAAFCKIYESYNSLIYHLAIQYMHDQEDARDIVQETFIKLWETRKTLSDHKNLGNYLYTIAKNLCINVLSKRKNSYKYLDSLKQKETEFNLKALHNIDPSKLFQDEIQVLVRQALDESTPEARKIFTYSRFSGKTNKEIAEELDISIKTVEYHMAKILRILRVKLKDFITIAK
jgi:RNA polymerase sigma-70 factor (ECF subfamily)